MKPLIVLLAVFLLALFGLKIFTNEIDLAFSGRIAMSAMLLFTAVGHFAFTQGMSMMIPKPIPYKATFVYITGFLEIMAAVGLLVPSLIVSTGYALLLFFVLMLPANIYAAMQKVDYQKGTYDGSGMQYLWFRVPLQLVFIAWVYFSAIVSMQ